jgi:hypothetical protein
MTAKSKDKFYNFITIDFDLTIVDFKINKLLYIAFSFKVSTILKPKS